MHSDVCTCLNDTVVSEISSLSLSQDLALKNSWYSTSNIFICLYDIVVSETSSLSLSLDLALKNSSYSTSNAPCHAQDRKAYFFVSRPWQMTVKNLLLSFSKSLVIHLSLFTPTRQLPIISLLWHTLFTPTRQLTIMALLSHTLQIFGNLDEIQMQQRAGNCQTGNRLLHPVYLNHLCFF